MRHIQYYNVSTIEDFYGGELMEKCQSQSDKIKSLDKTNHKSILFGKNGSMLVFMPTR